MSNPDEISHEESDVQVPAHFTFKIEHKGTNEQKFKAQGNKCSSDISRVERDIQPAHFTLKIESYSSLLEALDVDGTHKRYESGIFDAGGYKWKLILYPYGNNTCEGKDNISLYLVIDESNSFSNDNWIVCINFKLFVLNQKTMKYLTIQDAKGVVKYFDKLRTEHGLAELLSRDEFNDSSNGYLVNDCCVFGVEVLVIQPSTSSEETITMVKELNDRTYTWSIKDFSNLNENDLSSDEFTVGGENWKLKLFPQGLKSQKGKSLALFLWLQDREKIVHERKVYAKYKLRVLDPSQVKTVEEIASHWFDTKDGYGFFNLISLKELSNGYLENGTLIVEVEFDVISAIKVRP